MARRISLDTGVLIGLERGTLPPGILSDDDDICLSIIVIAEYMAGIRVAHPHHQQRMQLFLDRLLSEIPVMPFDEETLDTHVRLYSWTHKKGCPRGQHDLIIASLCVATDRILLTTDRRARFHEFPGIKVELVS